MKVAIACRLYNTQQEASRILMDSLWQPDL